MHILLGRRAKEQGLVQMMCKFPRRNFFKNVPFCKILFAIAPVSQIWSQLLWMIDESSETTESDHSILSEEPLYLKKAKKTELSYVETALCELAKKKLSSPKQEEDEWDVFKRNVTNSITGSYIRAGSQRSSPASLPGFASYFHCFKSQDKSRRWTHNRLLFTKLRLLKENTESHQLEMCIGQWSMKFAVQGAIFHLSLIHI